MVEAGSGFVSFGVTLSWNEIKCVLCHATQSCLLLAWERLCMGHGELSLPILFFLFLLTLLKDKTSCGGLAPVVWKHFQ